VKGKGEEGKKNGKLKVEEEKYATNMKDKKG
jgi:hypothetical protein